MQKKSPQKRGRAIISNSRDARRLIISHRMASDLRKLHYPMQIAQIIMIVSINLKQMPIVLASSSAVLCGNPPATQ